MVFRQRGAVAGAAFVAVTTAVAAEAPIQSVTLYPGSATVERVVQVAPGATQVEITGLLANFDKDTVRLHADAGIQVGQVVTRDQGRVDSPSAREADLDAKVQALQDQVAAIDADIKSAQIVQGYLERLGAGGDKAAPVDAKNLTGTLDAIRKGAFDALERVRNDDVKKRLLSKQLDVLKRDLARAQASTRESRTITVQVAARQGGKLLLSYQVNRAGWKPTYRAALDSNAATIDLERLATISQKTGEDWSNVRLRLSTGQPNLIVYAPDPSPWLLNYQPPVDPAMFLRAPAPPPPPAPSADYRTIRPVEAAGQDDYIAPILETQGTFTTEFEVPARVTLASDGREIAVGLSRQTLKAEQRVLIAPRSGNEAAVVTARAPRPDGVWLPGQVQLQRDGSYVGAQHWDPQAGDRLQFAFGRDPLVRVTVEHRDRKSGEVGFFNGANQRRIADTYVVTSTHRQPVDVLVLEPTPISESDKVTVKTALRPEPDVRDWEHRRGLVGRSRTLKPNETARFDVDYVIDYPKDGVVQGLP
ncbi:DUF4139 domain-containing protein [Massilia sp. Root335]|uniref:DUF4139 domain-containing protein n=1 Tax=Massilia sp. Root335 TaxID=1736517 RepID=UPI0006F9D57A|nr:DUF4139 domain-containing protein [Massilia sp. Root335]KQV37083.1 hypothetical protein ASC93_20675 [Massilia sp. Root335]